MIQQLLTVDPSKAKLLAKQLEADPGTADRIYAEAAKYLGRLNSPSAASSGRISGTGFFAPQTPQAFKNLCAKVLACSNLQDLQEIREPLFTETELIVAEAMA
jgi:hypothetical protein